MFKISKKATVIFFALFHQFILLDQFFHNYVSLTIDAIYNTNLTAFKN